MHRDQSTNTTTLRELFHKPALREIGGVKCYVYKFAFEQFQDAIALGDWWSAGPPTIDALRTLAAEETPQSRALLSLIAGSIKPAVPEDAAASELPHPTLDEVRTLPAATLAEAILEIMEINADFFSQTLPKLSQAAARLMSIGGALSSSSSAPATDETTSPDTH